LRSISLRFITALLTFGIGIAISSVWLISRVDEEQAPCRSCATIYASQSEIPTVSLRELEGNEERYKNRVVRVNAVFRSDAGTVSLHDESGGTKGGFAENSVSCVGAEKSLSVYSGYETWYDGTAHVAVIGKYGRIEPKNFYQGYDGFNIMCLERAKPTDSGLRGRISYTVGKLGNYIFPAKR